MGKPEFLELLAFHLGPLHIGATVLTTWLLMALLVGFVWFGTRRLSVDSPSRLQMALEGTVLALQQAIEDTAPGNDARLLPFIGTLWLFIAAANLMGLVPGLRSPTGDLSLTVALAMLVFLSVHWFGIRIDGLRAYLRHYLDPNPILLPFHLLGEVTRTLALAVRLFGNMMSLEMAALLVLLVAGFLAPIPLLMLHIVEALVQAYIFGTLALVYVAGALQSHELNKKE
ncbi:ATP synthase subunit a (plasmid) [Sulfuricella denitrificans skB26]|uniref:ATP synthase subunit a n=1 Tax=Sulfuricella denitrificans (strain DSM 22764 / NBRC 105220 / skB26) TaxID=1163617 RepID=S6APK7_SULDS|nr:F0F1 ATP synthase subunit A [Sulfuricella denitrificans]BAN36869.1 ATP synthase subunit a [Sulfuricella denitrificans skB26]